MVRAADAGDEVRHGGAVAGPGAGAGGVRLRAGQGRGPTEGPEEAHPLGVQAARAQCPGEPADSERTHGREDWQERLEVQRPGAQLQQGDHLQG